LSRPSILVIDQHAERRMAISRGLAELNFEVVPVADQREGLRYARVINPWVIVASTAILEPDPGANDASPNGDSSWTALLDFRQRASLLLIGAACPAPQAQQIALELAAINGRIIFFGGLPADKAHVSLNTNLIHYKQLEVTGTTRQSLSQYRRTLRLVACGRINIKDLISSRTALAEIQSALDNISQARSLKSAIYFE